MLSGITPVMHMRTLRPVVLLVSLLITFSLFWPFCSDTQHFPLPFLMFNVGICFPILWQLSALLSFIFFVSFFFRSPSFCSDYCCSFKISLRFPTHDCNPILQVPFMPSHGNAHLGHCHRNHPQPCLLREVFAGIMVSTLWSFHWTSSGNSRACKQSLSS